MSKNEFAGPSLNMTNESPWTNTVQDHRGRERERASARAQAGYIYTQESVARVDRYIHKAYYRTLQEYNGGVMSLLQ